VNAGIDMARAFISAGSNIDPGKNIKKAIIELALHVRITGISTVYLTEAEGRPAQPRFYNCVVEVDSLIPPEDLKYKVLRRVEESLGRKRNEDKYAERPIDLDLILYGDLVVNTDAIHLPDPQILVRPFIAIPLRELSPGLVLPGLNVSIDDVAGRLGASGMKPLTNYTETLRREIHHEG
jgi:2-amino-4-hydroxy-6-hydroxymethyldihydropteridine diphosphokinase